MLTEDGAYIGKPGTTPRCPKCVPLTAPETRDIDYNMAAIGCEDDGYDGRPDKSAAVQKTEQAVRGPTFMPTDNDSVPFVVAAIRAHRASHEGTEPT